MLMTDHPRTKRPIWESIFFQEVDGRMLDRFFQPCGSLCSVVIGKEQRQGKLGDLRKLGVLLGAVWTNDGFGHYVVIPGSPVTRTSDLFIDPNFTELSDDGREFSLESSGLIKPFPQ